MRKYALALEIVAVILLIALIAGVALPAYNRSKYKAKEAEVKNNLHTIQLALEQYGEDTEGEYPPYLIGGDMGMTDTTVSNGYKPISDQLLHKGYLQNYPKNPFVNEKNASAIVELQKSINDPMRVGAQKKVMGTRFGDDCTLMGNVSCDYRYPTFKVTNPDGKIHEYPTGTDFEGYPYYDVWESKKPKFYLPGEFFYKSMGPVIGADPGEIDISKPVPPIWTNQYILGGYGSIRTKGEDVFGPEPSVIIWSTTKNNGQLDVIFASLTYDLPDAAVDYDAWHELPTWTRWQNEIDQNGYFPGSPYSIAKQIGLIQVSAGNPNGIPDGIVLILGSDDSDDAIEKRDDAIKKGRER